MKKHIALIAFGVLVVSGMSATPSFFTAQTGNQECVGKQYGFPGCPLKVVPPPSSSCGNGRVEEGEECDLAADNGTGECSNECKYLYCGDGMLSVALGEECEPDSEEVYIIDPDTGNLTTEVRYLSRSCGTVCTAPTCDDEGNCSGGCSRQNLPACPTQPTSSKSSAPILSDAASSSSAKPSPAACGNGIIEGGEQCDDGNKANEDACSNNCRVAICGDMIRQPWEQCDDGNKVEGDLCSNECLLSACGDGSVQQGEECDDGNRTNDDTCSNVCRKSVCGDGIRQDKEACDDGNAINDDTCTNACVMPRCGDSIRQDTEECDDGNNVTTDSCGNDCTLSTCGDAIVQRGEECDDGNAINADACSNDCTVPVCGDGIKSGTEQCDDGNSDNEDGCSTECRKAACGDGIIQQGEDCDDGNTINADACPRDCKEAACGNNIIEGAEECDLGKKNSDTLPDMCRKSCALPYCGDGVVDFGEECDGGELCSNECTMLNEAAGIDPGSSQGGIPFAILLGFFGFAAIAVFFLRKEMHGLVSKVAGEKVARSIDDIPLDEIEMPWHNWS